MAGIGRYVLSIITASVIVAILSSIFDGKGAVAGIVKLACGLFLTFVVISPLVNLDFSVINDYLENFTVEGLEVAAGGENLACEARCDIITSEVQAYILDKGGSYGANLDVEVVLDRDNIPVSVTLKGNISPYAKIQMTRVIEEDLGISKEQQIWIG